MLNPDGPMPSPKKKALKKRLGGDVPFPNPPQKEDASTRANDRVIAKSIDRQVAPPPGKPAYKAPDGPSLSAKRNGPLFNPKAQIDNMQTEDRVQSESLDNFITRMVHTKTHSFMAQWVKKFEGDHPNWPHSWGTDGKPSNLNGKKSTGTKDKEALLARLRSK